MQALALATLPPAWGIEMADGSPEGWLLQLPACHLDAGFLRWKVVFLPESADGGAGTGSTRREARGSLCGHLPLVSAAKASFQVWGS